MANAGIEAPWAVSQPPHVCQPGETITYAIKLHSHPDGVTFTLEEPAPGMSVAADGTFTWNVAAGAPAELRVTVRVKAAGGESVHAFVMTSC
jgi:hypothetical protein